MHARQRVTRSSFTHPLLPIVAPQPLPALPERIWSAEDWATLELGHESGSMEEKWDVVAEGDVLFLHRSWTGFCIYEVTLAPVTDGGRRIVSAVVERSPERYKKADDEYDGALLELVLTSYLLGESALELRARFQELSSR
ncbi:hypothetical protein [Kribbella sp. VKM Ac-2568]|uniref:hypothetical protein n=1 Tax=Kribbella sp. VKM Ac-2568 TaxID=2512219 RepID=UPI00105360D9|nr:hypothetical protein [Kribbella sp. VKM Ac-2568]TCM40251.1 hypothetical protein EV648_11374 [Kribbella sp. VKM Ac-2568]